LIIVSTISTVHKIWSLGNFLIFFLNITCFNCNKLIYLTVYFSRLEMIRADTNEKIQPDWLGNVYQQMNGVSDFLVFLISFWGELVIEMMVMFSKSSQANSSIRWCNFYPLLKLIENVFSSIKLIVLLNHCLLVYYCSML